MRALEQRAAGDGVADALGAGHAGEGQARVAEHGWYLLVMG
jgi:hypothetical protein